MERLILLDVEFHSATPPINPEVVRRCQTLIEPIHRKVLLQKLGLHAFCQRARESCLIWINNELIPLSNANLQFDDGAYIRIAVPPGGSRLDHVSTRCLATAFHRGLQPQDVLDRHTMVLLGWNDHVVDPPLVPLPWLNEEREDMFLLQCAMNKLPPLPDTPDWQRHRLHDPQDHFDAEVEQPTFCTAELQLPQPMIAAEQELLEQPAAIQELHHLRLRNVAATEPDANLDFNVITWYLDFPHALVCRESRAVSLSQDFTTWLPAIVEQWDDQIDPAWPINLYIVKPNPPATAWQRREQVHIIVVQRAPFEQVANLFTIVDHMASEPVRQRAGFISSSVQKVTVIMHLNYIEACFPEQRSLQCMVWQGDIELRDQDRFRNRHGLLFVLIFNHIRDAEPHAIWEDEEDTSLLQHQVVTTNRISISLEQLLPMTTAVRLIDGIGNKSLPSPLEVELPGTASQVQAELLHWGHHRVVHCCPVPQVFLCLNACEEETQSSIHYIFWHDDHEDPDGCILHSAQHLMTENDIMTFLCRLGYARAVVLQEHAIVDGWRFVTFHHREPLPVDRHHKPRVPTPWPERRTHQRITQPMLKLDEITDNDTNCRLRTAFTLPDLQELFSSADDILCTDFDIIPLEDGVREELRKYPVTAIKHTHDLDRFDRLLIFTDGSSQPTMKRVVPERADELGWPDTWSIVVIGEIFDDHAQTETHLLGWAAFPVRYDCQGSAFFGIDKIGSDCAERAALIGAAMWRISKNHKIPTLVCTDSWTGGGQARGDLGTSCVDDSFYLLRGLYQTLNMALPLDHFEVVHVRAHAGMIFNEIADAAAKQEAQRSYNCTRQMLDMRKWRHIFVDLWTLFGDRCGLPEWQQGGLAVLPPTLPPAQQAQVGQTDASIGAEKIHTFCLSLATANVQSLYRSPQGHAGKLHYLQQQMRSHHLAVLAIQEARSEQGMTCTNNILRIASGHHEGHYGVELWFDLDVPYAYCQGRTPLRFCKANFVVAHCDPRRLLVRATTECLSLWFYACHAPHSGRDLRERGEWWASSDGILAEHLDGDPLILLIDANAEPGPPDHRIVFGPDFRSSSSTSLMRDFLEQWSLCLPATGHTHCGDHGTWINFEGTTTHFIDHIAVPQSWCERCLHSEVLQDFDLATPVEDHRVLALQLQWQAIVQTGRTQQHALMRKPMKYRHTHENVEHLKSMPIRPWCTDVETQAEELSHNVHQLLAADPSPQAKKPYVSDAIWEVRARKLRWRKKLKQVRAWIAKQLMIQVFAAWHSNKQVPAEEQSYVTTLYCSQVKNLAGFRQTSKTLTTSLRQSKQIALRSDLEQLDVQAPAAEILRTLRPYTGPSNPRKQKRGTLPMIQDKEGHMCTLPTDVTAAWVDFFQEMEGGARMSYQKLREIWIEELQQFQQWEIDVSTDQLPRLTDLEVALRRIPRGRSCGPDGIPGEVCLANPTILAQHLYPHLLKTTLHGHEYVGFKGGRLTPVHKGRGSISDRRSYRSLLVSNHFGKSIHRAMRNFHAPLYEKFLQLQQSGGKRKVPVQMALHQLRAWQRDAHHRGMSCGVIFLDLTEAFYRILREAPMGGEVTDELVAHLMKRLNMPEDSLHQIHQLLSEQSALAQAGMSEMDQRALRAVRTSTHFWVHGQLDVSRTRMGTRPGDSLADFIFGFAWSCVLTKVQNFMIERGFIQWLPGLDRLPLFGVETTTVQQQLPFIGPNWMDDLALTLQAPSAAQLTSWLGSVAGFLLDTCRFHCLSPNLMPGKTELMATFRGAGSRQQRINFYGPLANRRFPVVCEGEVCYIQMVTQYKHLGSVAHHTGEQKKELRQKAAVAHSAFNHHKKVIFQNRHLALERRVELFQMLVLSKLLYGADSWIATDGSMDEKFKTTIMNLYRRLLKLAGDCHICDEELLVKVGMPSADELLRRARLRYIVTLVQAGLPDLWALLHKDVDWCRLLEQDMVWMWRQLSRSSDLQDPRLHYDQWYDILVNSPKYWKRLVRRAIEHCVLQRKRVFLVRQMHANAICRFHEALDLAPPQFLSFEETDSASFGCMQCQKRCRNAAGEAAHMHRVHHEVSNLRHLFDQPTCSSCLKHFHTMAKLKAHLYYSRRCRDALRNANMQCEVVPGAGSITDHARAQAHDRYLPPLPGQGPRLPAPRPREYVNIHAELYELLIQHVSDFEDFTKFEELLRKGVGEMPISWSSLRRTVIFFADTLAEDDANFFDFNLEQMRSMLQRFCSPSSWTFLQQPFKEVVTLPDVRSLETHCEVLEQHIGAEPPLLAPRSFGVHRILLHAYSGRRRVGDLQFYMERMPILSGVVLHTVSMDIIIHAKDGDATNPETRLFWLAAIRDRFVIAFVSGPPCETWSRARAVNIDSEPLHPDLGAAGPGHMPSAKGPRVIRDVHNAWGYEAVRLRELFQLIVGNELLGFSLLAMVEISFADALGILEHPAEAEDQPTAASIWRLPLMATILSMPNAHKLNFSQGLMGARTTKPTSLLTINLESLMSDLHQCRVRTENPVGSAIGKNSLGQWRTTELKEYGPALCRAMAISISKGINSIEVDPAANHPSEAFLDRVRALVVHEYGSALGAGLGVI
eukprot:s1210_g6.t1